VHRAIRTRRARTMTGPVVIVRPVAMGDAPLQPFAIRAAIVDDAAEIARLLTELGHPTSERELVERWQPWLAAGNTALVATVGPGPALRGLATLGCMFVLHRKHPVGRITALVVDPRSRGQGIGRALVHAAERQLAARGCGLLEVTSNEGLAAAHAFYQRLGYRRTSLRFVKDLVPPAS
jgi:ribosomal protein S18 acetylase RimI-like enzyme